MGDFLDNQNRPFEASQAMDVSAKVMVAAIIVLFMIIVFIILLHLYAKWAWNRRAAAQGNLPTSHRRRRSRFIFVPSQDQVVTSLYRGLEPSLINSLPVLTFNPDDFKDGLECAVCLSELTQGEKARLLPKCNHGFHVDCIDMWFQSHSTCPLCRNPIADTTTSNPELPSQVHSILEPNPINGFSLDTPNFPTNVLFWGDQTQVSTRGSPLEEDDGVDEDNSSSSFSSSTTTTPSSIRPNEDLVIEVPQRMIEGFSSMSPSTTSRFTEEDLKSPMTTRLRSFRRLLSREKKIVPCSPNSIDLEQGEGGRGQSSKTALDSPHCYATGAITAANQVDDMST